MANPTDTSIQGTPAGEICCGSDWARGDPPPPPLARLKYSDLKVPFEGEPIKHASGNVESTTVEPVVSGDWTELDHLAHDGLDQVAAAVLRGRAIENLGCVVGQAGRETWLSLHGAGYDAAAQRRQVRRLVAELGTAAVRWVTERDRTSFWGRRIVAVAEDRWAVRFGGLGLIYTAHVRGLEVRRRMDAGRFWTPIIPPPAAGSERAA